MPEGSRVLSRQTWEAGLSRAVAPGRGKGEADGPALTLTDPMAL